MNVVLIIVGIALLIAGRKLFWLLVAALGFLGAYFVAQRFFDTAASPVMLVVALGCALLGAALAVMVQKIAIGAAGFVAGGILLWNLSDRIAWHVPTTVLFVVGGVIGAILAALLFQWALIVLSSVTGSYLIVREAGMSPDSSMVVFLLLAAVGCFIQAASRRKRRPREDVPSR